jgi:hypothetical protein
MTTRMIVVGLLALTIIVAAGIWAAADSLERSAVKVGVRRCLSNMVAAGTYTTDAEAQIRADVAEMQQKWGVSARQALEIECGRRT